jgi:L-threonylcarbamoyladenylate synthase
MLQDVEKAVQVLRSGGIILYPTDTIWGIGCDATNADAVKKIYSIKQRDDIKSMLVLLADVNQLYQYVNEVPDIALQLIEVADKPLTIIYPDAVNLAKNLVAPDKSIGIRIPQDDFCQTLLRKFKKPLVSTSANISGQTAPANFNSISKEIKTAVDFIINYRQDDHSKSQPSSIIKLSVKGEIEIIRK